MSYLILKSIKIDTKNNQVFLTGYSNNITPKIAERWEAKALSKILQEQGKDAVEKQVLLEFWNGNFQGVSTKYGRFYERFFKNEKGMKRGNTGEEKGAEKYGEKIIFSYAEVKEELFLQFLNFNKAIKSKEKYIIKVGNQFISKLRRGGAATCYEQEYSQKFNLAKAQEAMKRFSSYEPEMIAIF